MMYRFRQILLCQYILLTLLIGSGKSICTNTSNCYCTEDTTTLYAYKCATSFNVTETQIIVQIQRNGQLDRKSNKIIIQCQENYNGTDYIAWIRTITDSVTENIAELIINNCPIPNVPFADIFNVSNAKLITNFELYSARELDGSKAPTLKPFHFSNLFIKRLDLENNKFEQLPENLFENLSTLEKLHIIKSPTLKTLPRKIFEPVPQLTYLSLSNNNLTFLDENIFQSVPKLETLCLGENKIVSLPTSIFSSLIELRTLNLQANNLKMINDGCFDNLKKLKTLYLNRNRLSRVPVKPFIHNTNLKYLDMYQAFHKDFTGLSSEFFTNLISLEKLLMGWNYLSTLPSTTFHHTPKLQHLSLRNNKLSQLEDTLFDNLNELRILDLSNNSITSITKKHLDKLTYLINLDLSYNKLTMEKIPSTSVSSLDHYCDRLQHLNMSHNLVRRVFEDWIDHFYDLKTLDLSHNKISKLTTEDFKFLPAHEMTVYFNNNEITAINLDQNALKNYVINRKQKIFHVNDNPLKCDCDALGLAEYLKMPYNTIVSIQADKLICDAPHRLRDISLVQLSLNEFKCPPLKDKDKCPTNCSCDFRAKDATLEINCTSTNRTKFPSEIPSASRIELLYMNNEITSTNGLQKLIDKYKNITKIVLSFNKLERFNITLGDKLEVLELDNNKIAYLDGDTLEKFKSLKNVTLHNNPWKCDCSSINLLNFVQSDYQKIPFHLEIRCDDQRVIKSLTADDLCEPFFTIFFITSFAVLALLTAVFITVYFTYQHEIRVWMFAHKICLTLMPEEADVDKLYDAFVSFSHKDQDFVDEILVPELEQNKDYQYKLCIHHRDFKIGEFIPSQIADCVENSKRTIIVLTPNFLRSVWGLTEFRLAHLQAIKERRTRVIIILLEDISNETLDPELKAYITMNTYVKWDDPWFWEKLKYALPHPQMVQKKIRRGDPSVVMGLLRNYEIQAD